MRVNPPPKLIYLNTWSPVVVTVWKERIKKCAFVEGNLSPEASYEVSKKIMPPHITHIVVPK